MYGCRFWFMKKPLENHWNQYAFFVYFLFDSDTKLANIDSEASLRFGCMFLNSYSKCMQVLSEASLIF